MLQFTPNYCNSHLFSIGKSVWKHTVSFCNSLVSCTIKNCTPETHRIAGYFRGVLIFAIFVTSPSITKFCTHKVFHLRYKLLVLLLTLGSVFRYCALLTVPHIHRVLLLSCVDSQSKLRSEEGGDTSKMRDYYLSRLLRKAAVTVN